MMARELMKLMIGDILMAYHDDGETLHNFPVIIDGLDNNGTLVDGGSYVSWKPMLKEDDDEENADELTPIPLTAEILEKNGWTRNGIFSDIKIDENTFFSWADRTGAILYQNGYYMCDCEYVHTLQHALRLCGLTDLADNLKV